MGNIMFITYLNLIGMDNNFYQWYVWKTMSTPDNIDESHWPPLIIFAEVICHLFGIDQSDWSSLIFVKVLYILINIDTDCLHP